MKYIIYILYFLGLHSYRFIFQWDQTCCTQATATLEVLDFSVSSSLKPLHSNLLRPKEDIADKGVNTEPELSVHIVCDLVLKRSIQTFTSFRISAQNRDCHLGSVKNSWTLEDFGYILSINKQWYIYICIRTVLIMGRDEDDANINQPIALGHKTAVPQGWASEKNPGLKGTFF